MNTKKKNKGSKNKKPLFVVRKSLLVVLLALFFCGQTNGQENNIKQDSAYQAIEKYSKKRKFTKFFYHLIFRHIETLDDKKPSISKKNIPKPYRPSEGKIIRNILIVTIDPFGYKIKDTSRHPKSFVQKSGNSLHLRTHTKVIKNLLLFKRNDPYDSLLVNESERIIRSQKYIRDVLFSSLPTSPKADSIDVYIRVRDVWSIVPEFNRSSSSVHAGLTDVNFVGLGHRFEANSKWNNTENYNDTQLSYLIPNIGHSLISLNMQYLISNNNNPINNLESIRPFYSPVNSNINYLFSSNDGILKSVELTKTFYSPLIKWAGGIFLGQMITAQSLIRNDSIQYLSSKTNIQDYWMARSWQMFKGNSLSARTTNFILSGRMLTTSYPDKPQASEQENIFNNENIYFVGAGVASRNYIKDKFIFEYAKIEDVPVGRAFGVTLGMDTNQTNRWYLGFKAGWGNYFSLGYLSAQMEYGTFIKPTGSEQGVITGRINYFTKLFSLGKWKIRQFIKPSFIFGINRLPSDNLPFGKEMKGFEGYEYQAKHKMILTLQTQSYAPWNVFGFNFGPYLFSSVGMLGNEEKGFSNSRLYSLFGLGILIKNDNLIFNKFQISMTFYPSVPGGGYNIFKTNAYQTGDYGFTDFDISKPEVVDYR
ncbi:MAG: hypothetical protein JJE44_12365 [Flavobacteriaceae bacterium]|nr:hypothetical protein [Flavobacteriaceae bacterium]